MYQTVNVSDLISKFNLPIDTEFVGFVVHLPDSDEFLGHHEDTSYSESFIWVKLPDLAYIFSTEKQAKKFVKSYGKGSIVGLLFDLGDSFALHIVD